LPEMVGKESTAKDVVDMGMGEQQVADRQALLVDIIKNDLVFLFRMATGINEYGLALIVADVTVGLKRVKGEGVDSHSG